MSLPEFAFLKIGFTQTLNSMHAQTSSMIKELIWGFFSLEVKPRTELLSLKQNRERCMLHLEQMRPDHMRRLNPTPYKVSFPLHLNHLWFSFSS